MQPPLTCAVTQWTPCSIVAMFQNCKPDYLTVHKMQYLDMFVNELLRLHTVAAM